MAHKDGSGYFTKVVLVENGEAIPRRVHRMEWQDENGVVKCTKGQDLPHDLIIFTGKGFQEEHFARFLGIKTTLPRPWLPLPTAKGDLVYVIVGAALVLILKGVLALLAVAF